MQRSHEVTQSLKQDISRMRCEDGKSVCSLASVGCKIVRCFITV